MDVIKTGIFIQEQRKMKQLSQKQLAEYLHVSPTTVCKWEKGVHIPDIANLELLADLFQVSVQELIEGEAATAPAVEPAPVPEPPSPAAPKKYWKIAAAILSAALLLTVAVISVGFATKPRFQVIECFYPTSDDLGLYAKYYQPEDLFCIIVKYSGNAETDDFEKYNEIIYMEYIQYYNEVDALAIAYFKSFNPETDSLSSGRYQSILYDKNAIN